jgi:hypothetical protein
VRFSHVLFIAIIFAMTGYSCKDRGRKNINQGEIHYNIDYVGDFGVPKEFLPKNLIISFKNDKLLYDMSGLANSGIFNLINPEKGIYDTYFSIPPRRYYYAGIKGELYPGFSAMEGMVLKKTNKTAIICGFNCKNAEVTFVDSRDTTYNIWYTNEIKIENPNASTPFSQIDGVLMNFFFFIGKSEMHFTAEGVYRKSISEETFERKIKFTRISREDITRLINKLGNL